MSAVLHSGYIMRYTPLLDRIQSHSIDSSFRLLVEGPLEASQRATPASSSGDVGKKFGVSLFNARGIHL